jgi:ATP-dependent Clp protease ATP-binding subunit ClpB
LKRAIQRLVVDPLALRLLEGAFEPGDTVLVDATAEGITLSRDAAAAASVVAAETRG